MFGSGRLVAPRKRGERRAGILIPTRRYPQFPVGRDAIPSYFACHVSVQPLAPLGVRPAPTARTDTPVPCLAHC